LGIRLVVELAGIDAQLAKRKLGKKIHPDHGSRQRPLAAMVTPPPGTRSFDNHPTLYLVYARQVYVVKSR
jgi:hypothetical protein